MQKIGANYEKFATGPVLKFARKICELANTFWKISYDSFEKYFMTKICWFSW